MAERDQFEPAVLERFAEVGVGAMLEEAFEVGEQGGMVGLDAENEVGAVQYHTVSPILGSAPR